MKINRFIALAALALLVVGAMGALSLKGFAQSSNAPPAQTQPCDQQDDDTAEVPGAPDTDTVELECGDQHEADDAEGEAADGTDTDDVQEEVGDQNEADETETDSGDGQDDAPVGTPAITAEAAQATAEAYLNAGTSTKVELDDENGQLIYSVEFSNGTDVKVDAMTGEVLGTEPTED